MNTEKSNYSISPTVLHNMDRSELDGEKLFVGRTWIITTSGIERVTGMSYYIDKNRLLERRDELLEWLIHIANKPIDYDLANFLCCYVKAFELYGVVVDDNLLVRSIEAALTQAAERLGDTLRMIRRRPLNEPIEAKLGGHLIAHFHSAADYMDPAIEVDFTDWRTGWNEPDPMLVMKVEGQKAQTST